MRERRVVQCPAASDSRAPGPGRRCASDATRCARPASRRCCAAFLEREPRRPLTEEAVSWTRTPRATSSSSRSGCACTRSLRSGCARIRRYPLAEQPVADHPELERPAEVRELDEDHARVPAQPIPAEVADLGAIDPVDGHLAAGSHVDGDAGVGQRSAQLADAVLDDAHRRRVVVADVRCRRDQRHAVGCHRTSHLDALLERPWPVVDARQQVAVEVDHRLAAEPNPGRAASMLGA